MAMLAEKKFGDRGLKVGELVLEREQLLQKVQELEVQIKQDKLVISSVKQDLTQQKELATKEIQALQQELADVKHEALDAKEEIKLEEIKVSNLKLEVEELKHQLKVMMDREKEEVARFMLYQKIKVIKEVQTGEPNIYDADKLIDEFDEEGWSWPSSGRGGDEEDEEGDEVSSTLNPSKTNQDVGSTGKSKATTPQDKDVSDKSDK